MTKRELISLIEECIEKRALKENNIEDIDIDSVNEDTIVLTNEEYDNHLYNSILEECNNFDSILESFNIDTITEGTVGDKIKSAINKIKEFIISLAKKVVSFFKKVKEFVQRKINEIRAKKHIKKTDKDNEIGKIKWSELSKDEIFFTESTNIKERIKDVVKQTCFIDFSKYIDSNKISNNEIVGAFDILDIGGVDGTPGEGHVRSNYIKLLRDVFPCTRRIDLDEKSALEISSEIKGHITTDVNSKYINVSFTITQLFDEISKICTKNGEILMEMDRFSDSCETSKNIFLRECKRLENNSDSIKSNEITFIRSVLEYLSNAYSIFMKIGGYISSVIGTQAMAINILYNID